MEKHAECAAAISSSGLVLPLASSVRAAQDTSKVPMPEDSRVTWPAPSKRLPSQCVVALRVVAMPASLPATGAGSAEWAGEHLLRRDRRRRDLPPHRRPLLRGRRRPTRCSAPLYPEEDLGPAEERFRLFLVQYWGGPTTYSDTRGHPRLRMRHAPFAVTPTRQGPLAGALPGGPRRGGADARSRTRSSGTTSPTLRSSWSTPSTTPRDTDQLTRCNDRSGPRQEGCAGVIPHGLRLRLEIPPRPETWRNLGWPDGHASPALPSGHPHVSQEGEPSCYRT